MRGSCLKGSWIVTSRFACFFLLACAGLALLIEGYGRLHWDTSVGLWIGNSQAPRWAWKVWGWVWMGWGLFGLHWQLGEAHIEKRARYRMRAHRPEAPSEASQWDKEAAAWEKQMRPALSLKRELVLYAATLCSVVLLVMECVEEHEAVLVFPVMLLLSIVLQAQKRLLEKVR